MVRAIVWTVLVVVAAGAVAGAQAGPAATPGAAAALPPEVIAAMGRAHELASDRDSDNDKFLEAAQQAAPGFAYADAVYGAGGTRWRMYMLNAHGLQFDGLRFRTPPGGPSDLFWAFMLAPGASMRSWYIIPAAGPKDGVGFRQYWPLRNLRLEGLDLPAVNMSYAQAMVGGSDATKLQPNTEYAIWFNFADKQPNPAYVALNVVPAGTGTDSAVSIARILGMRPTGLENACTLGDHERVAQLLQSDPGAVARRTLDGGTLLHGGAGSGSPEVVAVLLRAGVDPNAVDADGQPPLSAALDGGYQASAVALLAAGADPNVTVGAGSMPALLFAAWGDQEDSVRALLAKGARTDERTPGQQTALHLAVRKKSRPMVEMLARGGAPLEALDKYGQTALMVAAADGDAALVETLLDAGAAVDTRTPEGETALHSAAFQGKPEVVKLLLARGAQVNARTGSGTTPLHAAAQAGQADVVALLLEAGADPNARRTDGATPLAWASQGGHQDVVELLRKHGAAQ